jgi:hypothetical protein
MNFLGFNKQFPTELAVINRFIKLRYSKGIIYPRCGAKDYKIYHSHKPLKTSTLTTATTIFLYLPILFLKNLILTYANGITLSTLCLHFCFTT